MTPFLALPVQAVLLLTVHSAKQLSVPFKCTLLKERIFPVSNPLGNASSVDTVVCYTGKVECWFTGRRTDNLLPLYNLPLHEFFLSLSAGVTTLVATKLHEK